MARRRKSTGFFGTMFAALTGGTSVRRTTTWTGKPKTIVTHHGSGKTKTYIRNQGFFGDKTTTKTTKHGRTIETGEIHRGFFGGTYETARRPDGSRVHRSYHSGIFRDYTITDVQGDCHACAGTGTFDRPCRNCAGEGCIDIAGTACKNCAAIGVLSDGRVCPGCGGDGFWIKPHVDSCYRCAGSGRFRETCRKCSGSGKFHGRSRG